MANDHDERWEQQEWQRQFAIASVSASSDEEAAQVARAIDAFAHVQAPEAPEVSMRYITVQSLRPSGGTSRKPGNVLLNWRRLFNTLPELALGGVGATSVPRWLVPLACLHLWNRLNESAVEELSDVEASTITALWLNRRDDRKIDAESGFDVTNRHRRELGLESLTKMRYEQCLDRLQALRCVELRDGVIWLREWVRVPY